MSSTDEDRLAALAPLRKLVELALVHADIGPPLADLAFAIGQREIGDQLLRIGTDRENPQLEYFVVAAHAARRGQRYPETLRFTLDALKVFAAAPVGTYNADDAERLLYLLRTGISVLMFDLRDLNADPAFTTALAETLPKLEDRLTGQPLYLVLVAESLWFVDRAASEAAWDKAQAGDSPESLWNARGTWYKEAEKDLDKAERAYRTGLGKSQGSALLMHNIAQVLVERAEKGTPQLARTLLHDAQELLRRSLQADAPRLRRHIHATRDRLEALRRSLPAPEPPPRREPEPPREQPAPQGQTQAPQQPPHRDGPPRRDRDRDRDRDRGPSPERKQQVEQQKFLTKGTVSLGDMLRAKLLKEK